MNILPIIVQESVSQCKKQGFGVSANLASFYIKTQLLTAKKDPSNNVELAPDTTESLVNACVRTLTLKDSAMLETFKLQASVTGAQQEQVNQVRTERVQHKGKGHRLMEDIWTKKDPNEVFNDICVYVMHECHAPSLTDELIQRETTTALENVFPRALMDSFVSQRESDKIRQLEEIWRIVWGIRLYNRQIGKGGTGIPRLLEDTRAVIERAVDHALSLQEYMQGACIEYHAVLACPSLALTDSDRLRLQDEYLNRLQVKVYIKSVLTTLATLLQKLVDIEPTWDSVMQDIDGLVSNAGSDIAAVPKSAIFPKFITLSERWDVLFALHREACDAASLYELIASYKDTFTPIIRPSDIDNALAALAEERACNREMVASELTGIEGIEYHADLSEDKRQTKLEFNGFCIVSFVDEGVLVEGKTQQEPTCPGYILLHANNSLYAFSSERALKAFARDPFKYLSQRLMDAVAANAALIYLLGLHPYLPKELYLIGSRKHETQRVIEKGDGATQTGHIDTYKDTHYVWNEWELRRLALQLAALRSKRTKSSQTQLSHFRRDNDCQVFLPKETGTQTLLDAAVQPPRVVQYLKGLRGTADSKSETVERVFLY